MSMDDPLFIAILAGLMIAYAVIGWSGARKSKAPPPDFSFEEDGR